VRDVSVHTCLRCFQCQLAGFSEHRLDSTNHEFVKPVDGTCRIQNRLLLDTMMRSNIMLLADGLATSLDHWHESVEAQEEPTGFHQGGVALRHCRSPVFVV